MLVFLSINVIEDCISFDLFGCCATFLAHYNNNIIHNVHGTKNPHHTNLLIETASIIVWLRREKRSFPLFFPKLLNYHVVSLS